MTYGHASGPYRRSCRKTTVSILSWTLDKALPPSSYTYRHVVLPLKRRLETRSGDGFSHRAWSTDVGLAKSPSDARTLYTLVDRTKFFDVRDSTG